MFDSTKPLTKEENEAIQTAQPLYVEKLTVHGTYKNGVPFVREYPMGVHLFQQDRIALNYIMEYPDPLREPVKGMVQ